MYPFGYGLSYTTFENQNLTLGSKQITRSDSLAVSVEVQNTGERAGEEVVQLYIRDLYASITRPVKELCRFRKIHLEAGESRVVNFTLTPEDLSFYNTNMDKVIEPGEFHVYAGGNSVDLLQKSFEVK